MKKALYCQEEIVLADPHNYQNHNRYADILYTIGGETNVRTARRHFAQSIELNPENNLRAGKVKRRRSNVAVCSCNYR